MKQKTIAVGNQVYTIHLLPTAKMSEKDVFGLVDQKRFVIEIDESLPPESRVNTLLHELTHVFMDVDVGSKNNERGLVDVELACNLVANGVQEVILKNKASFAKVIAWLIVK